MSDQEIFEMLSKIECELFYKAINMSPKDPAREVIGEAHQAAKTALEAFASATGCHN